MSQILRSITITDDDGNELMLSAERIRETLKTVVRDLIPLEIPVDIKRINVLSEDEGWVKLEIDINLGLYVMGKQPVGDGTPHLEVVP